MNSYVMNPEKFGLYKHYSSDKKLQFFQSQVNGLFQLIVLKEFRVKVIRFKCMLIASDSCFYGAKYLANVLTHIFPKNFCNQDTSIAQSVSCTWTCVADFTNAFVVQKLSLCGRI